MRSEASLKHTNPYSPNNDSSACSASLSLNDREITEKDLCIFFFLKGWRGGGKEKEKERRRREEGEEGG